MLVCSPAFSHGETRKHTSIVNMCFDCHVMYLQLLFFHALLFCAQISIIWADFLIFFCYLVVSSEAELEGVF